jgi:hypothetical protein
MAGMADQCTSLVVVFDEVDWKTRGETLEVSLDHILRHVDGTRSSHLNSPPKRHYPFPPGEERRLKGSLDHEILVEL